MRDFLTIENLRRASLLGAVATLMAIPRILQGGLPLEIHGIAAFCVMTAAAGAVMAWGKSGGMQGAFPSWRRQLCGVGIAILFCLLLLPFMIHWIDPIIHAKIAASGNPRLMDLSYPTNAGGIVALMLWCAGFETLFFHAATISFFARLSGKAWIGILGSGALRLFASLRHQAATGVCCDNLAFVLVPVLGIAVVAGILFSRTGLIPAATLGIGLNAHLIFVDYQ